MLVICITGRRTFSFLVFTQLVLRNERRNHSFEDIFSLPWSSTSQSDLEERICPPSELVNSSIQGHSTIKELCSKAEQIKKEKIFKYCQKFILKALFVMKQKEPLKKKYY